MRALRAPALSLVPAAVALLALAGPAAAQCPLPDNLSGGPCCTQTQVDAPRVPNFKEDSLWICWKDCDPESIVKYSAVFSSPTPKDDCTNYEKRLRLKDSGGVVLWNGRIKFRYSRTWMETDPSGAEWQVWRFLANGDLRPTAAAGTVPCPIPACTPATGSKVRFSGYVDYALDCGANLREYAFMLSHACDQIDHAPGFPRAGAFHPDRSYTLVGPAAGFVVGALQPVESGGGITEDIRRIARIPGTNDDTCEYEERIQHQLDPLQQFCLCGPTAGPQQFALSNLFISGACGSTVNTTGGPFLPGFMSQGIGAWTTLGTYPGNEALRWNCGGYQYGDPCTGILRDEVFFGVTTINGWAAKQVPTPTDPGIALPLIFVDQGNSLKGNTGTRMNTPYRSDHILNLNY